MIGFLPVLLLGLFTVLGLVVHRSNQMQHGRNCAKWMVQLCGELASRPFPHQPPRYLSVKHVVGSPLSWLFLDDDLFSPAYDVAACWRVVVEPFGWDIENAETLDSRFLPFHPSRRYQYGNSLSILICYNDKFYFGTLCAVSKG